MNVGEADLGDQAVVAQKEAGIERATGRSWSLARPRSSSTLQGGMFAISISCSDHLQRAVSEFCWSIAQGDKGNSLSPILYLDSDILPSESML
jgi:hypothetical protein